MSDHSYAIVYHDIRSEYYTIPCDCPNTTANPRRSFVTESTSECGDTIEQDRDVGFTDPPHVPTELSIPGHQLDEHPVTPVDDTNPTSHCHQDADYPDDGSNVPIRSIRQVKKPTWLPVMRLFNLLLMLRLKQGLMPFPYTFGAE